GALAVAFRASFTPAGVQVDAVLDGSLFAKAGLRAGDLITSVEGRPLRSLDDVAALYARAGSLRIVTAQGVRGGKPLTLRAVIQWPRPPPGWFTMPVWDQYGSSCGCRISTSGSRSSIPATGRSSSRATRPSTTAWSSASISTSAAGS